MLYTLDEIYELRRVVANKVCFGHYRERGPGIYFGVPEQAFEKKCSTDRSQGPYTYFGWTHGRIFAIS